MVSDAGHAIGNRSWDHKKLPGLPRQERLAQIRNTDIVLQPHIQKLFRPPFGEQNIVSRLDALLLGYEVVGWSIHAYGGRRLGMPGKSPRVIRRSSTNGETPLLSSECPLRITLNSLFIR